MMMMMMKKKKKKTKKETTTNGSLYCYQGTNPGDGGDRRSDVCGSCGASGPSARSNRSCERSRDRVDGNCTNHRGSDGDRHHQKKEEEKEDKSGSRSGSGSCRTEKSDTEESRQLWWI
jgi:hypothetical protein